MSTLRERLNKTKSLTFTFSAIFAVLVFLVTSGFSLYIPQTRGFFNIGEAAVYVAALLGGPYIGSFAGGFGSMLADIFLGYYIYAPATLVIKGLEGFIVGYLSRRGFSKPTSRSKALGLALTLAIGVCLLSLGSLFYIGEAEITIQLPLLYNQSVTVELIPLFWAFIALLFIVCVSHLILKNPDAIWLILAMAVGGIAMVLGYFLYEQLILGVVAVAEIPFNVSQMLVGMTVAIYIYRGVKALS